MKKAKNLFNAIARAEMLKEKQSELTPCKIASDNQKALEMLKLIETKRKLTEKIDLISFDLMQDYSDYWEFEKDFCRWIKQYHKAKVKFIKMFYSKCY